MSLEVDVGGKVESLRVRGMFRLWIKSKHSEAEHWHETQCHYHYHQGLAKWNKGTRGRWMPFLVGYVGEGWSTSFHFRYRKSK